MRSRAQCAASHRGFGSQCLKDAAPKVGALKTFARLSKCLVVVSSAPDKQKWHGRENVNSCTPCKIRLPFPAPFFKSLHEQVKYLRVSSLASPFSSLIQGFLLLDEGVTKCLCGFESLAAKSETRGWIEWGRRMRGWRWQAWCIEQQAVSRGAQGGVQGAGRRCR